MPRGMPRKIGEDQLLEGGGGGGGARGGVRGNTRERAEATSPKERAALENLGKQFEVLTPLQKTAMEKVRKSKEEKPNIFEMSDAERAGLSPAQLRKYGSDITFKKGGNVSASKRADGIAQRGKTKGRYI